MISFSRRQGCLAHFGAVCYLVVRVQFAPSWSIFRAIRATRRFLNLTLHEGRTSLLSALRRFTCRLNRVPGSPDYTASFEYRIRSLLTNDGSCNATKDRCHQAGIPSCRDIPPDQGDAGSPSQHKHATTSRWPSQPSDTRRGILDTRGPLQTSAGNKEANWRLNSPG
jgi:hypothetical protein